MMPGANLYLPNSLHKSPTPSAQHAKTSDPGTKYFDRRPKSKSTDSERPSIALSRVSSENVVHVFSSLPIVFDFANFALSQDKKLSGDCQTFVNLLQRVRQDVNEVSRLYGTRAITDYLQSWPDKKVWIDNILLDIQRALNDIGAQIQAVRVSGDDGGAASLKRKFDWVLSHHKKLLGKQQYLTTCHQSLMAAVQVMNAAEMSYTGVDRYGSETLRGPHVRQKLRLTLKNNSLPSITVSEVEGSRVEVPAENLPIELPGSTPDDMPAPDDMDLYAPPPGKDLFAVPPARQRSLSTSAVPTPPEVIEQPIVSVPTKEKPAQVYIAYNPRYSLLPPRSQTVDVLKAPDAGEEKDEAPPVELPAISPEIVASPTEESNITSQVATLHEKPEIVPPMISPLVASPPPVEPPKKTSIFNMMSSPKQAGLEITPWPARSSSKAPPKAPPQRKTFDRIKPLPLYTRSRSSDAVGRPRALTEQLQSLEDRARASFDSKPKPMPVVEEKPANVYNTAASVRVSTVSPLNGPKLKEVSVRKPPLKSNSLPMELPDLYSTGSLMDELSHWVLPPGARTSVHSLETSESLDMSTPATSVGGSPVINEPSDTKDTEATVTLSPTAVAPSEALKSPSGYSLFPSTPTTPGLPSRPPPPLPKDLLPRIEKPKTIVTNKHSAPQNASRPLSPEGPAPTLPPRPRVEITEPEDNKTVANPPAPEETPPALPPRPSRSHSPVAPDPPTAPPSGPVPSLPLRIPTPQASSSSLSNDAESSPLKRGPQSRQGSRAPSKTRQPTEDTPSSTSPSTTTTPHHHPQLSTEKALPIPPELRTLTEQLKSSSKPASPIPNASASSTPTDPLRSRSKVDVTMEAHPGTLVVQVPSFPVEADDIVPSALSPPTSVQMELPPIETSSHVHAETGCVRRGTKCESRVTAQTKRRQAHARRMQAAAAED
ncbi:unnamed protein product [Periconia digitata]|uniref:Uncharacterized protein n=1 Tax=Periconia digitata TaxID=1303443 RepID=A0A9W4XI78_9PLEO|nr:unnamed protein product [Periconia digitata]